MKTLLVRMLVSPVMVMMKTLLGRMLVSPVMVMKKTLLVRMLVSLVWKGVEKQQAADYDDGGAGRRLGGTHTC